MRVLLCLLCIWVVVEFSLFVVQAEDGIRAGHVTGVQTCALPISLGGGVAMQLAYQFPEQCERLVLVASGGLVREITALLRAASLPGTELVLPLLVDERIVGTGRAVGNLLGRVG